MARNRKRAKERRSRRTDGRYPGPRVGPGGAEPAPSPFEAEDPPSPIEHATPDVELAEEQLLVGRPELVEAEPGDDPEFEAELDAEALGTGGGGAVGRRPPNGGQRGGSGGGGAGRGGAGEFAVPAPAHAVAPSGGILARLIGFLQGSWRELQRVQWPDRRQVAQATGVVIGFVIVAGVFLGLADLAFSHLMNYILK